MEAPTIASLPGADPSTRPAPKPELNDYICLNFVKPNNKLKAEDHATTPTKAEKGQPEPAAAKRPARAAQEGEGIKKRAENDRDRADGNEKTTEDDAEKVWRGSAIRVKSGQAAGKKNSHWRDTENASPGRQRPLRCADSASENGIGAADQNDDADRDDDHDGGDGDDDDDGDDESKLYTRMLGSSVSIIDEKDAVARNGGARFVGEDPIRGRLRAADPFLWMGRLHAGAAAISILIDTAKNTLMTGLNDSSTNETASAPDSIASDQSAQGEVTLPAADAKYYPFQCVCCQFSLHRLTRGN